jgi:hypothetical protein
VLEDKQRGVRISRRRGIAEDPGVGIGHVQRPAQEIVPRPFSLRIGNAVLVEQVLAVVHHADVHPRRHGPRLALAADDPHRAGVEIGQVERCILLDERVQAQDVALLLQSGQRECADGEHVLVGDVEVAQRV